MNRSATGKLVSKSLYTIGMALTGATASSALHAAGAPAADNYPQQRSRWFEDTCNLELLMRASSVELQRCMSDDADGATHKEKYMTGTITLFDPTAPRREAEQLAASVKSALTGLSGAVVGFIDNAKPNFGLLADDLAELLTSKYGVVRVIKRRKPSASVPAKPEVVDELAEQCDLVITGSGD
jgi:hypothetical protein